MKKTGLAIILMLALVAGNTTMAQDNVGNLLKNGGFENGPQGALPVTCNIEKEGSAEGTVAIDNSQAHSGKQSVLVHMTSPTGYLHPTLSTTLKPGLYTFRVWAKMEPEQSFRMQIYDTRAWSKNKPATLQLNGKGLITKECLANNKEWSKFEIEVDVTEEFPASIQIGLTKPGKLWLDDVEIIPSKSVVEAKQSEQSIEIQNGKIALHISKGKQETIMSYMLEGRLCKALSLNAFQNDKAASVDSFKIVKQTPYCLTVDVTYKFTSDLTSTITYSVKSNFEYIEAESDFAQGKVSIMTTIKSDAILIPDFLADSIAQYPKTTDYAKFDVPSDNHILINMIDGGNAMLSLLWESPQFNVSENRGTEYFNSVILSSGIKTKFLLGILADKGIWYKIAEKLNPDDFTELTWKAPFPAEWMMATFLSKGFDTDKNTCESWGIFERVEKPQWWPRATGSGITNSSIWQAWGSNLGTFIYPCYFLNGKTFAKKPVFAKKARTPVFDDSPYLIYALSKNNETPAGINMPKNTLWKILPKEISNNLETAFSPKSKYPATCGITEKTEKIFYRNEAGKEKAQIISMFEQMNMFVLTIRERIEEYVSWQQKIQQILDEQKKLTPQLNPVITELEKELTQIPSAYAEKKDKIKTPAYCKALTEKVVTLIDATLSDEEKEEQCKELGRQIRTIGGNQDGLLGIYRNTLKACRQYTTMKLMTSSNATEKEFLEKIRHETALILNNRFGMEGK